MSFVLDASIALTWCFPDGEAQKAEEISERIADGETVIVPAFWRHEILNALLVGEKRKRLTPELTSAFIEDLNRLPIKVDLRTTPEDVFKMYCSVAQTRASYRSMDELQSSDQTIRFDRSLTRTAYSAVPSGNAERCGLVLHEFCGPAFVRIPQGVFLALRRDRN